MDTHPGLNFALVAGFYWFTTYALASEGGSSSSNNTLRNVSFIAVIILVIWITKAIRRSNRGSNSYTQLLESYRSIPKVEKKSIQDPFQVKLEKRQQEQKDAIEQLVRTHESTLYAKKLQTVKRDAYGNLFDEAWQKEKAYFHNFVVKPSFGVTQNLDEIDTYPYFITSEIIEKVIYLDC